jgi:hypothetical protein
MKEKIIAIIGFGMEQERAECMAAEVMELFNDEIWELKQRLQQAEDAAGANEQRAREAEQACRDLDKGYLKLGLY